MSDALPREFALIAKYFRPLAGPGALDLSDDAALLTPPPDRDLVLTADAMVGGQLPSSYADLRRPQSGGHHGAGGQRRAMGLRSEQPDVTSRTGAPH